MVKSYGTLQLLDTLYAIDTDNVFTYGEDRLYSHIRDLLNVHNKMTRDIAGLFVANTTNNIDRFGSQPVSGEMVELDEYGRPDVQKSAVTGYDIGYPLRGYGYAIGWTRKYFETKSVADITKEFVSAQTADIRNIKRRMMQALFRATNYTFIDRLTNSQDLPVKALQNADGTQIPMDAYGNTFDGATHTHLVGHGGAFTAADITALISNVSEHGVNGGQIQLFINKAQEATVRGFTANFSDFQAPLLAPGGGSTANVVAGGRKTEPYLTDDRIIGVWDGAYFVWTKPWVPSGYMIAMITGGSNDEILRLRTRNIAGYGNYRLVADHEHYPLRANIFEREFGVGVWDRVGAAILDTANSAYTQPTISG